MIVASYGLLVSRTALAFADPKHWNLDYAMAQLYRAFETESQKPGKVFHELVRRRRRELGLPVPPEERVLPFWSRPSAASLEVDNDLDCETNDPASANNANSGPSQSLTRANLKRVERRLEELDLATQEAERCGASDRERQQLAEAFEQELEVHAVLRSKLDAE